MFPNLPLRLFPTSLYMFPPLFTFVYRFPSFSFLSLFGIPTSLERSWIATPTAGGQGFTKWIRVWGKAAPSYLSHLHPNTI